MIGDGPRIVYNPDDGSVELHLGGPAVTVENLDLDVAFERMMASGEAARALWLEPSEVDVLGKMVRYILERVRITEGSRETLEALLPRLDALGQDSATGPAED